MSDPRDRGQVAESTWRRFRQETQVLPGNDHDEGCVSSLAGIAERRLDYHTDQNGTIVCPSRPPLGFTD